MTGGPDGEEESSQDSRSARLLMVAVLVLAVASTAVLVLSDNTQWLRLGVLAALWAALLGVFLASRFRKAVAERDSQVADLQSVYELELEREVAARREYELEVEAEARKRVEEANREDLAELRNELRVLRESLDRLNGGEVLVERFALRAQSTRMRTLSEGQGRMVASGEDSARLRRSIVTGPGNHPNVVDAQSTELIARSDLSSAQARREPQRREGQRPAGYRPEPSRPQTPRDGGPADDDRQRREPPASQAVAAQPTRVTRPVPRPQSGQPAAQPAPGRPPAQRPAQPSGPLPHPAAQTQQQAWPGQAQSASPQPGPPQPGPPQPGQRQPSPSQRMPRPTAQRPVQGQRRPQRVEPTGQRAESTGQRAESTGRQRVRPDSEPTVQSSLRDVDPVPEPGDVGLSARLAGGPTTQRPERPRAEPAPQRAESTGGHRRAVEEPVSERSRHRVDEAPRDWQSYREWRAEAAQGSGHHAKVDPPASAAWQEDDPETTGAHAAGKSVTELLAAHGKEDAPRRHRRRAE
jgi:hypothetical protein